MRETNSEETQIEDFPSTQIQVSIHVHFGMTGSFPLRLADLFFADDGLHITEYGYITPLFGLGMRKHQREASKMQAVYDCHGLDEVLLQADSVTWLAHSAIKRVIIHDGGRFGRLKVTVCTDNQTYAYRIHDEEDERGVIDNIETYANQHGFAVETVSGVGFSPVENIRRFFA